MMQQIGKQLILFMKSSLVIFIFLLMLVSCGEVQTVEPTIADTLTPTEESTNTAAPTLTQAAMLIKTPILFSFEYQQHTDNQQGGIDSRYEGQGS